MAEDEGKNSEWNEGNFKSKRLHDLQERINFLLANPLEHNGKEFFYEEAFPNIIALFTEGRSKYSKKKQKECEDLEELIKYARRKYPAYQTLIVNKFGNKNKIFKMNDDNYTIILNLINKLHRMVLQYNDDHGLSTRNRDEMDGLF